MNYRNKKGDPSFDEKAEIPQINGLLSCRYDIMEYRKGRLIMGKAKIAITLDAEFISELDRLVEENYFQNRSQAICDAVREKLARMKRSRLSVECAKLDPKFEKAMAEEGLAEDVSQWPEY